MGDGMNRRNFLRSALTAMVGAAVVPRIPLPTPEPTIKYLSLTDINAQFYKLYAKQIHDQFFQASPLLEYLRRAGQIQLDGGGDGIKIPYYFYDPKT